MGLRMRDGGDPTKAIAEELIAQSKEATRDAIQVWHNEAVERIMEAAHGRATEGLDVQRDRRGSLKGRENNRLHELANEMTAPMWDDGRGEHGGWVFANTHANAIDHEFGTLPHEIRARFARALVFEWPDAPREVREKFRSQWESTMNSLQEPQVAFNSVDHPGVPAIGMFRYGRDRARDRLERAGFSTRTFGLGGEET